MDLIPLANNPQANPIRYYGKNVLCTKGEGTSYIPLALNERPGRYKLTARDVLTGVSAEAFVNIFGPAPKAG